MLTFVVSVVLIQIVVGSPGQNITGEIVTFREFSDERNLQADPRCVQEGDSCDDGIYCNGEEFCNLDLVCISQKPPCTECNEQCDDYYRMCIEKSFDCLPDDIFTDIEFDENTCECVAKLTSSASFFRNALPMIGMLGVGMGIGLGLGFGLGTIC